MTHEIIDSALADLGLTVDSVFVPFSQSRNKDEKRKTLNWRVTVKRNGRAFLTTDYSAGIAHCPSYGTKAPTGWPFPKGDWQKRACDMECEEGFTAHRNGFSWRESAVPNWKAPILPEPRDVIHCLVMDSSVLDAGGFENWASDLGYDPDSRKAESIYRACLDLALAMRAALGDEGLRKLQEVFQEY